RVPALGEVPEPLAAAPSDDGDLAVDVKRLEHQADVAVPVPAVLDPTLGRAVFEVAREERPTPLELAQHVATEGRVLLDEVPAPAVAAVGRRAPVAPHPRAKQGQRLDRVDEGVELDELPVLPEQPPEL